MSLMVDQKEDLRLRMADLEKKLAESEEERCKLEKTCNILMRAFREEERMHYNALNKKYEKFLEDCTARKRRNDIILRSLRRIEDRSRALFAKTERLKLLKDRYISYLNLNDYRTGDLPEGRSLPASEATLPRQVQWTTPLTRHLKTDAVTGSTERSGRPDPTTADWINYTRKGSDANGISTEVRSFGYKVSPAETGNAPDERQIRLGWNQIRPVDETEGNFIRTESVETVKKGGLSFEGEEFNSHERHDPWIGKARDVKASIATENTSPRINYSWTYATRDEDDGKQEEDATTNRETEQGHREGPENLPMGLDGVDYQNETYPESYYEQPVHHNHASIASDVILEEDETEQEEEENYFRESRPSPKDSSSCEPLAAGEPQPTAGTDKQTEKPNEGRGEEVRGRESESEKSTSDRSSERPEKKKAGVKSNLIHLLESDSESFQIEHGGGISGTEDSDFDFSFHQN